MDNTKKFTNKADKYVSSRPSYPTKLMDYLYNEVGFLDKSKIADIGAGTGIFTRQLLERDSDVRCLHHILLRRMMNYLTNTKKTVLRQCRITQRCTLVKYSE